jgi:hypothetical protein
MDDIDPADIDPRYLLEQADARILIAQDDPELCPWLLGCCYRAGDFLRNVASAGLRADNQNYSLLRPVLLQLKAKYPEYTEIGNKQFPWGTKNGGASCPT